MQEMTRFVEWTSLRKAEWAVPELASDKNAERHTLKMLESAFLTLALKDSDRIVTPSPPPIIAPTRNCQMSDLLVHLTFCIQGTKNAPSIT